MKIGDEVFVHGYVDEMRKDTVIIRNDGGYFGTDESELYLPSVVGEWNKGFPEEDGIYLITKISFGWNGEEHIDIDIAKFEVADGWHKSDKITAWMPLPEPYKE